MGSASSIVCAGPRRLEVRGTYVGAREMVEAGRLATRVFDEEANDSASSLGEMDVSLGGSACFMSAGYSVLIGLPSVGTAV